MSVTDKPTWIIRLALLGIVTISLALFAMMINEFSDGVSPIVLQFIKYAPSVAVLLIGGSVYMHMTCHNDFVQKK